jgi:tetratricopeptide (TPR) repeat protein
MKHIFLIVSLFSLLSCATAQQSYSTKNKKAISLFEEGQKAPNQSASPNGMPNYPAGIALMDKAIEKDPMFWEAYLVAGEFAEYSNQYSKAIKYYEEALLINPNHSVTGSTQFYLANLKFAVADYKGALDLLKGFISNRNANPEYVKVARELQASCEFSIQALNNPSDFEPINIGPGINTKDPEYFPTITVDGKTILFTRRIFDARVPRHLDQPENLQQQQEDFYISHLSDKNIWMKADPMPVNINTVNNEGAPTLGPDGRTLIFVGCPDQTGENYGEGRNGKGSCDFFITKKLGQKWTNPINLPGGVNTRNWETQPSLSSD